MPPLRFLGYALSSLVETSLRRLVGRGRRRAWRFGFEVVVGIMRRNFMYTAGLSLPEARSYMDAVARSQPFPHPVSRTPASLGAVSVVRFEPREKAPTAVLVYLHGGSYVMGSTTTHGDLIARLALAGPFETIGVDYRLAPEHGIRDAVADACAVYRALLEEGRSPSEIVFAGDSAGGGLVFLALVALRDAGTPLPAATATIAPWGDLTCPGASIQENERFDWGRGDILRAQARLAAAPFSPDAPEVSPMHTELRGMPPSLVHVGDAEIVRDAVLAFVEALRSAANQVELKCWPDMVHDFHLLAGLDPAPQQAIDELAAFLRSHAGSA